MDFRQIVAAITAACFLGLGFQGTASATVIGTQDYLSAQTRADHLATVNAALSRADVQAELVSLGVDPADAVARVAALSDAELAEVSQDMQALPAGGDGLFAVIGVVFIVLLILELTGVTDIFKKI